MNPPAIAPVRGRPAMSWFDALGSLQRGLGPDAQALIRRLSTITLGSEPRPVPDPQRPYGRRLLLRDSAMEALLCGWRPGLTSAPHDHGGARGAVVVLSGCVVESTWQRVDDVMGGKPADRVQGWQQGSVFPIQSHTVHQMESVGPSDRSGALTLHVYLDSDGPMRVFDPVERVTFHVKDGTGAWLPQRPRDILEMTPWLAH